MAGAEWAQALANRLSLPGQRPYHLLISPSSRLNGRVLLGLGCNVKSLALEHVFDDEAMDGDLAAFLDILKAKGKNTSAIQYAELHGAADAMAMGEHLIAQGRNLRILTTFEDKNTFPMSFSPQMTAQIVKSVAYLTYLSTAGIHEESLRFIAKLLNSCKSCLVDLSLEVAEMEDLKMLQFTDLHQLKFLEINIGVAKSEMEVTWLETMPRIVILNICSEDAQLSVIASLMSVISNMTSLRELSISMSEVTSTTKTVSLPLRLKNLQTISLSLNITRSSAACVLILDWDEILSAGMPIMEDVTFHLRNVNLQCYRQEGIQMSPQILFETIIDATTTPMLACVDVTLADDNDFMRQCRFELAGGRSQFTADKLEDMREQLNNVVYANTLK
ncbi:hypothetical protein HK101_002709 [Irineochytrium annulatum]|nr:hypothetical protein HK101_002709 [Irineochytrium annulatum]